MAAVDVAVGGVATVGHVQQLLATLLEDARGRLVAMEEHVVLSDSTHLPEDVHHVLLEALAHQHQEERGGGGEEAAGCHEHEERCRGWVVRSTGCRPLHGHDCQAYNVVREGHE